MYIMYIVHCALYTVTLPVFLCGLWCQPVMFMSRSRGTSLERCSSGGRGERERIDRDRLNMSLLLLLLLLGWAWTNFLNIICSPSSSSESSCLLCLCCACACGLSLCLWYHTIHHTSPAALRFSSCYLSGRKMMSLTSSRVSKNQG